MAMKRIVIPFKEGWILSSVRSGATIIPRGKGQGATPGCTSEWLQNQLISTRARVTRWLMHKIASGVSGINGRWTSRSRMDLILQLDLLKLLPGRAFTIYGSPKPPCRWPQPHLPLTCPQRPRHNHRQTGIDIYLSLPPPTTKSISPTTCPLDRVFAMTRVSVYTSALVAFAAGTCPLEPRSLLSPPATLNVSPSQ